MDKHAEQTRTTLRDERLHTGGAGLLDRGNNTAARCENIEVGHTRHLQLEFTLIQDLHILFIRQPNTA